MASKKDTTELAKEIGLHVPKSLTDDEQLKLIADQIGMNNYEPTTKGQEDLYKALKDKQLHIKTPINTITMVNGTTTQTDEIVQKAPINETTPQNIPQQTTAPSITEPSKSLEPTPKSNPAYDDPTDDEIEVLDGYDESEPTPVQNETLPENNEPTLSEKNPDNNEEQPENGEDEEQYLDNNQPNNNTQNNQNNNQDNNQGNNQGNKNGEGSNSEEKKPADNNELAKNEEKKPGQDKKEEKPTDKANKENKSDKPETNKKTEKPNTNNSNPNNTLNNKAGKRNERKTNSDITKNGRKNLDQAKKAKNAKNIKKSNPLPKTGAKKKAGEAGKKAAKAIGNGIKTAARAVAGFVKNVLIPFIMSNPWLIIIFGLVLFLAIVLIVILAGDFKTFEQSSSYQGTQCSYDLEGVVNTGNVTLNDVVVELINCDGRPNNYTVLETVDFEKYALGVALAQMGEDAPDEAIKAQIIVARNFALTRNSTMCADDPENCFYGYNISTGKIRMRACDLDQVYWDYEKSIYTDESSGVKKYSPEATSSTGLLWKTSLTGERRDEVLALAREVKGKVLLDSEDKVLKISSSLAAVNNIFSLAYEGKVYEEILASSYGSNNVNTSTCSSIGNIDFGDYNLNSDGDRILHKNLAAFLSEKGTSLDEFNELIAKNVDKAGYGTRAGVVSAAVTLVAELGNKYDVKIPYFWGGGHSGGISEYADATWGSSSCHIHANNQNYNYCGLDCTGFVSWAIHNGGYNLNSARGNFHKMDGARKVKLDPENSVLQAGDLLESSSHVVMVIGVDNDRRQYICVEASGNEDGVWFTRRDFAINGYWGVLMDDYYNDGSNVRS